MAAVSASALSLRRSSRSSSAMHFLSARACSRLLKSDARPSPETKQSDLERDTHYAIDKLCSKDKVGVTGDHLAAIGGAGGFAVEGAATLLGPGARGSALGEIFVTTMPVGWVIGSAALMGAAGYGIAKMIRSGRAQDQIRKEIIQRLRERLEVLSAEKVVPDCSLNLVDSLL
jgi:hypothetical protein